MIEAHNLCSNISSVKAQLEQIKTVQVQIHENMETIKEDIKSGAADNKDRFRDIKNIIKQTHLNPTPQALMMKFSLVILIGESKTHKNPIPQLAL